MTTVCAFIGVLILAAIGLVFVVFLAALYCGSDADERDGTR